jgi:hypothetical protein
MIKKIAFFLVRISFSMVLCSCDTSDIVVEGECITEYFYLLNISAVTAQSEQVIRIQVFSPVSHQ